MKNPIRKFKEEILTEIKKETESLREEFNFLSSFQEDFQQIKEVLFYEPTPEEQKEAEEQAKEQMDQMKNMIQAAIIDLVNKPENQKAISDWAGQFAGAMSGKSLSGWENLMGEDGQVNWGVVISNLVKGGGEGGIPKIQASGKTGAY